MLFQLTEYKINLSLTAKHTKTHMGFILHSWSHTLFKSAVPHQCYIIVPYSHPSSMSGFQEGVLTVSPSFFTAPFDFWEVILARCQRARTDGFLLYESPMFLGARVVDSLSKGSLMSATHMQLGLGIFFTLLLPISHWQRSPLLTGVVIWGLLAAWLRGSEVCVLKWKANGAKEKHVKRKIDPGAKNQTVCWSRGDVAGGYAWVILSHLGLYITHRTTSRTCT